MRLEELRKLTPAQQKEETQKALIRIKDAQEELEKNGTFTFYSKKERKKNGGLVMQYIPNEK